MHGWFGNYYICSGYLVGQKAQFGTTIHSLIVYIADPFPLNIDEFIFYQGKLETPEIFL